MDNLVIDGFDIQPDPIGSGISGKVYLAKSQKSGERYAIKVYSAMAIDRQILEATLTSLDSMPAHDGLLQPVTYSMESGPSYAVTKWCDGMSLSDIVVASEAEAWSIIRKVADAMGHLHKYNAIHGNLHPGNVFYEPAEDDQPQTVQIGDFGAGLMGELCNVDLDDFAFFAAPEQLTSLGSDFSREAARRWDVYRFGALAFWLLRGEYPRGRMYWKSWVRQEDAKGGHSVPIDPHDLVDHLHLSPELEWGRKIGEREPQRQWKAIIESCLKLDPKDRPVDMREVRNLFQRIEREMASARQDAGVSQQIARSETQYKDKIRKQRSKLVTSRAAAWMLGISCIGASYFLSSYLRKTIYADSRIDKLTVQIERQQSKIADLDLAVEVKDMQLRQSRQVADSSFYQLTQTGTSRGGTNTSDLEQSRDYYLSILADLDDQPNDLAKVRALHSLAHIERQMGRNLEAMANFQEAVTLGADLADLDIVKRLADSYEYLGLLSSDVDDVALIEIYQKAIGYFQETLTSQPSDGISALRLAKLSFRQGKLLNRQGMQKQAIELYTRAAGYITDLRPDYDASAASVEMDQWVAKLQFYAGEAFSADQQNQRAIDAYIATIESIERLSQGELFWNQSNILLARSYIGLGDIFVRSDNVTKHDSDQVYNEALRLLAPMNRDNPRDVEVARLLCHVSSRIAGLEKFKGNPKAGYVLSVQGIESLIQALDASPSDLDGFLKLAEARLDHLEFLKKDKTRSRTIARRGIDTAKHAHSLAQGSPSPKIAEQLRHVFVRYGEICRTLGEETRADECTKFAAYQVTQR